MPVFLGQSCDPSPSRTRAARGNINKSAEI
jgi:hypothetical protein